MSSEVRSYIVAAVGAVFIALGVFSSGEADWARVVQVLVGLFLIVVAVREYRAPRR